MNKEQITLAEFLSEFEFDLVVTATCFKLVDQNFCNFGGIESEEFYSANDIVERLDVYIFDSVIAPLKEELISLGVSSKELIDLSLDEIVVLAKRFAVEPHKYRLASFIINPEQIVCPIIKI